MHTYIHTDIYKYMHTHTSTWNFRQRCHVCLEGGWVATVGCNLGGSVGVALIMRMLISFNVDVDDRRRMNDER